MFNKQTVKDIDLAGKTVVVRVDYNVPVEPDGSIGDLYRVEASLPTLKYLIEQKCKLVLISHLGRPEGKVDPKFSLKPVSAKLSEMIGQPVEFAEDCVGPKAEQAVKSLQPGGILLLENLRFHPEEEANDEGFAKQLASLGEVFVQDGFAVVHRAHASTSGITKFLPSVAGLLLEKEVTTIAQAMENPKRPLVAILGGAKVSDKIELIEKFMTIAQTVIIGGAMANTFFKAQGHDIGKSIYEAESVDEAKKLMASAEQKGVSLHFPSEDMGVGQALEADTARSDKTLDQIDASDYILDIGPKAAAAINDLVKGAGSVIWNGPFSMIEFKNFRSGSLALANAVIDSGAQSLIGGGDTAAFLDENHLIDKFGWVSTGGGASLELMAGKPLPGVDALMDR